MAILKWVFLVFGYRKFIAVIMLTTYLLGVYPAIGTLHIFATFP